MVPAENRLKSERDFKKLMRYGRAFFSKHLAVRSVRNDKEVSRFAFVVSVKTAKKAVDRNKIKRRMREIVRLDISSIKKGYDILIAGKKPALDCSYEELKKEIFALLKKARLLV